MSQKNISMEYSIARLSICISLAFLRPLILQWNFDFSIDLKSSNFYLGNLHLNFLYLSASEGLAPGPTSGAAPDPAGGLLLCSFSSRGTDSCGLMGTTPRAKQQSEPALDDNVLSHRLRRNTPHGAVRCRSDNASGLNAAKRDGDATQRTGSGVNEPLHDNSLL